MFGNEEEMYAKYLHNDFAITKSLKDYIELQKFTGENDIDIIKRWFIENHQESLGLSLIPELAQKQMDRVAVKLSYAQLWTPTIFNTVLFSRCNSGLDKDTKTKLTIIANCAALSINFKKHYTDLYEWAEENIPNMEIPKAYFMPTLNYLASYGIYFKGKEDLGRDQHVSAPTWWGEGHDD